MMNSVSLSEQQTALKGAVRRVLAARHLADYAEYVDPIVRDDDGRRLSGWIRAPHLEYLAAALEEVEQGDEPYTVITMPPRHGKTELVGVKFCPWCLGRHPDWKVMYLTHTEPLAKGVSRACRNVIEQEGRYQEVFPNLHMAADTAEVTRWAIYEGRPGLKLQEKDASFLAAGIGGGTTGSGAHLMVLDDIVKDRAEAFSQTARDRIWQDWQMTIRSRLNPGGRVVLIMTRWHGDDFAARLLADREWRQFRLINLPALAEAADPLGREVDEALWPERYSVADWIAIRNSSPSIFQAMYQGQPVKEEGEAIKLHWFGEYAGLPKFPDEVGMVWDSATSEKTASDFSCCTVGARTEDGNIDLLEVFRAQIESPSLEREVVRMYLKWKQVYGAKVRFVLFEEDQFGRAVIQGLKKRHPEIPVISDKADKDKFARVAEVSYFIEAGRVRLPRFASWLEAWKEEIKAFPLGAHDDQVDTLVYLLRRLCKLRAIRKDAVDVIQSRLVGGSNLEGF